MKQSTVLDETIITEQIGDHRKMLQARERTNQIQNFVSLRLTNHFVSKYRFARYYCHVVLYIDSVFSDGMS